MKDSIHTIVVVTAGEGKPGDYTFDTLFSTRNEAELVEIKQYLLERHAGFRRESFARNTRQVRVIAIDSKEHTKFLTVPGRNGYTSQEVHKGQVFKSASEASGRLGLRNNEVAIALARAAGTTDKTATLRGVTIGYVD